MLKTSKNLHMDMDTKVHLY